MRRLVDGDEKGNDDMIALGRTGRVVKQKHRQLARRQNRVVGELS